MRLQTGPQYITLGVLPSVSGVLLSVLFFIRFAKLVQHAKEFMHLGPEGPRQAFQSIMGVVGYEQAIGTPYDDELAV